MKKQNHLHTAGFTLIELLLYVGLISIFMTVLAFFFASSVSMRVKNQAENNVNQQASFVMEIMTNTIRSADSITSPTANNTGSSLTLSVPTAASSPTIFQLSGTTLQVKKGTAGAVDLTDATVKISSLSFINTSKASTPGSIQISLTMTATTGSTRDEFNYQETFTTAASLRP